MSDIDVATPIQSDVESTVSRVDPAPSDSEDVAKDLGEKALRDLKLRILHILSICPRLTPTMIQIGIGTGTPSSMWHPALEQLIVEGKVERKALQARNPVTLRDQTYTILELASAPASAPDDISAQL